MSDTDRSTNALATVAGTHAAAPHLDALARIDDAHERMTGHIDPYYWRDIADEFEAVVNRYIEMRTLRCRIRLVGAAS